MKTIFEGALYGSNLPAHLTCCSRQKLSLMGTNHEGSYEVFALNVTSLIAEFNLGIVKRGNMEFIYILHFCKSIKG